MRPRTTYEARKDGTLYFVRNRDTSLCSPYGECYPAAQTPEEAVACTVSWHPTAQIGTVYDVWNTDGVIGCQMLTNPREVIVSREIVDLANKLRAMRTRYPVRPLGIITEWAGGQS